MSRPIIDDLGFRTPYSGERFNVVADVGGPSLCKQSFKKDCDIHVILKQFDKSGMITHLNRYPAGYGDVSGLGDFRNSMNVVLQAETMFSSVPAKIRSRFGNDPAAFLEFVSNPDNFEEMITMGLANKPKVTKEVPNVVSSPVVGVPVNASAAGTGQTATQGAPAA